MSLAQVARLVLALALACPLGAERAIAAEQKRPHCTPSVARVAAESATTAYDMPGGSRIGYLAPGAKYFVAESRSPSLSVHDVWHMLVAPGGGYVGWVRSGEGLDVSETPCPRALQPIEFPLELLYRGPNR